MHPKPRVIRRYMGRGGGGLLVQTRGKRSKDENGHFLISSQSSYLFFRDLDGAPGWSTHI